MPRRAAVSGPSAWPRGGPPWSGCRGARSRSSGVAGLSTAIRGLAGRGSRSRRPPRRTDARTGETPRPSGQGSSGAGCSARVMISLPSGPVMPISVMRPPGVRGPSPTARAGASTSSFVVVVAVSGVSSSGPGVRARVSARAAARAARRRSARVVVGFRLARRAG